MTAQKITVEFIQFTADNHEEMIAAWIRLLKLTQNSSLEFSREDFKITASGLTIKLNPDKKKWDNVLKIGDYIFFSNTWSKIAKKSDQISLLFMQNN